MTAQERQRAARYMEVIAPAARVTPVKLAVLCEVLADAIEHEVSAGWPHYPADRHRAQEWERVEAVRERLRREVTREAVRRAVRELLRDGALKSPGWVRGHGARLIPIANPYPLAQDIDTVERRRRRDEVLARWPAQW